MQFAVCNFKNILIEIDFYINNITYQRSKHRHQKQQKYNELKSKSKLLNLVNLILLTLLNGNKEKKRMKIKEC